MSVTLSPSMFLQFFDPNNTGAPLSGGKLFTYIAGTSFKQATWTDSTQVTQNNNPIILDSNGAANVWLDPTLVYKFVLSPANDTDPPTSPFRSVDNISPNITAVTLTIALIGPIIYPRTVAEIALGVTPTSYAYPADPYVDPRRYGADPTGAIDSTVAVQKAINVAYQDKGVVWIGNQCNYSVGALSLTLTGNDTNDGFSIIGSSQNGSALTQRGTPGNILTIVGSTPTGNPSGVPIYLADFSVIGPGATNFSLRTATAVYLHGVGRIVMERVTAYGFDKCAYNHSGLENTFRDCSFTRSFWGIYCDTDTTGAPPNLIRIHDTTINGCSFYGVLYDTGSELHVENCDMEQNGYAATFTGNPGLNANAATLTLAWQLPSGAYNCEFPDGTSKAITFTNGLTAVTWTGGNAAQSAAWILTPTGAIHITGSLNASPTFGAGKVSLSNNWMEGNVGGYTIQTDAPTLSQSTWFSLRGGHIIASANNLALRATATNTQIENCFSTSPNDKWVLAGTYSSLTNCQVSVLSDTTTYPTYINVTTSAGHFPNGRVDNFTATLTGCTTSPTVNVAIHQQGDEIILDFLGQITAVSNTTAATLTGLPAKYWPAADTIGQVEIQNNSVNGIGPVQVAAATGVITLNFGIGFTAANNKGVVGGQIRLRKA